MNRISIVIPVHNLEGYIGCCLRSISCQEFDLSKVQAVCVLDKCSDGSEREIDLTAAETGLNVLKIRTENADSGLSRNIGLANADGDWIWFVDGDDLVIGRNTLSVIEAAATGDLVRPVYYLCGKTVDEAKKIKTTLDAYSFIIRKDFIGGLRFLGNDGLFESFHFFESLLKKSPRTVEIDEPVYFYRTPREGSITYNHRKSRALRPEGGFEES